MTPIHNHNEKQAADTEHEIALSLHAWLRQAARTQLMSQEAVEEEKPAMDILDHLAKYFLGSQPARKHERRFTHKRHF
jgi:hypothetical protein